MIKVSEIAACLGVESDLITTAAVFKAESPQALLDLLSVGFGAAMSTAGSSHGPEIMDPINQLVDDDRPLVKLPHHVLIVVVRERVHLRHSSRAEPLGEEIWILEKGTYQAHFHREPFQVELHLRSSGLGSEGLMGKWGFFHHAPMKTAKAVVELAQIQNVA